MEKIKGITAGEKLFEQYLKYYSLTWEYEPDIGGKHPDYLIHTKEGDVICEIKDFEAGEDEELFLEKCRSKRAPHAISISRNIKKIRKKINAAYSQFPKNELPCIIVLYVPNPLFTVRLDPDAISEAIWGNATYRLNPENDEITPSYDYKKGKLGPQRCTRISAIAILKINSEGIPTLQLIHSTFVQKPLSEKAFCGKYDENLGYADR